MQAADCFARLASTHKGFRLSQRKLMQQTPAIPACYTLDHAGHRFEVEITAVGLTNTARLVIDGQIIDEQQASLGDRTRLRWQQWAVLIRGGWWGGQVARCVLLEARDDHEPQPERDGIALTP